jgi:multidrug efflux system outer membrane protein
MSKRNVIVLVAATASLAACTSPVGLQSSGIDNAPQWQQLSAGPGQSGDLLLADAGA